MGAATLVALRERPEAEVAMLLIHGYGGDAHSTFGRLPEYLQQVAALRHWNLYSLGYTSTLSPDLRGVWQGDPAIDVLSGYLRTRASESPLQRHKRLALVAHSMGGLVVQHALVTYPDFVSRISHVLLFGTPSQGLRKARWIRLFKVQSKNMSHGSDFILDLRQRWKEQFAHERPFRFFSVAGDRDHFVPPESSLAPFNSEDCLVIPGNHREIVAPTDPNAMTVQVLTSAIVGNAAPGGPWNSARVAVELGDFRQAIDRLLPNARQLDDRHLVELALALDSTGKRDEAIAILKDNVRRGTDVHGVLAGRIKRRWLNHGREADARDALALYEHAYRRSVKEGNHAQAYYHGINLAFMHFAFAEVHREDKPAATRLAQEVLGHCHEARPSLWRAATEGEAHLYLGEERRALEAYEEAVKMHPTPREMESMYTQAYRVARLSAGAETLSRLDEIFRDVAPQDPPSPP